MHLDLLSQKRYAMLYYGKTYGSVPHGKQKRHCWIEILMNIQRNKSYESNLIPFPEISVSPILATFSTSNKLGMDNINHYEIPFPPYLCTPNWTSISSGRRGKALCDVAKHKLMIIISKTNHFTRFTMASDGWLLIYVAFLQYGNSLQSPNTEASYAVMDYFAVFLFPRALPLGTDAMVATQRFCNQLLDRLLSLMNDGIDCDFICIALTRAGSKSYYLLVL